MPKLVTAAKNKGAKTKKQKAAELAERLKKKKVVVHNQVRAEVHSEDSKYGIIDAAKAKKLLGWQEQPDGVDWGEEYFLVDLNGNKVRLTKNTGNRSFKKKHAEEIAQDILNRNWKFNGEAMIISKYDDCLSAQHRLIGVVFADQTRFDAAKRSHWDQFWPDDEAPYIESIIVYGVEDDDETVRTLDNTLARKFGDVALTMSGVKELPNESRKKMMTRMLNYALRTLHKRTNAKDSDTHNKHLTNSTMVDYWQRHGRITKAIKHVTDENKGNRLKNVCEPGTASALLYLMACSTSDSEAYRAGDPPSEKDLQFKLWDKACEYWSLLAASADENQVRNPVRAVRMAMSKAFDNGGLTREERIDIIINGWTRFRDGKKLVEDQLLPPTEVRDNVKYVTERADIGGIDWPEEGFDAEAYDKEQTEEAEKVDNLEKAGDKMKGKGAKNVDLSKASKPEAKDDEPTPKKKKGDKSADKKPKAPSDLQKQIEGLKAKYAEDDVMLLKDESGVFAYGADANVVSKLLRSPLKTNPQTKFAMTMYMTKDHEANLEKLTDAGQTFKVLERRGQDYFPEGAAEAPVKKKKKVAK